MGMRESYQEKADAQLSEWQSWIDQYKSEPADPHANQRINRQQMMERMDDCHRLARIRLKELRSSQDEHWDFAKQAVERAMIDLKRVIDESGAGQAAHFLELQAGRAYAYEPFQRRE